MPRDADQTKRRIFDAAVAEFAAYGVAGARVDRITRNAGVNNALLYRYFGNKATLFDTVFSELSVALVTTVPFTVEDLPGYVERLIKYYADHPEIVRIAAWYRLERTSDSPPQPIADSTAAKVKLLRQAQADGLITDTYPAATLLEMLLSLATTATDLKPPGSSASKRASALSRRRSATAAVARILSLS
ncbi:MAG TPA: TetR family transcriptional regulator [Pseudonocardiaceae bacterium]|jgi:AcrR family transcriptional regulator|nr:TetR family transcriptional regulator [Pseudonocardiaceae bacterium]